MSTPFPLAGRLPNAAQRLREQRLTWWLLYGAVLTVTLMVAGLAYVTVGQPFSLAVILFIGAAITSVINPVVGSYAVLFLAVVGDASSAPWYPFAKNLSSAESILFLSSSIKISPLEVCLSGLLVGWLLPIVARRRWRLAPSRFSRPLAVFTAFLLLGLATGLARGGDRTIALWEIRPLLYLGIFYFVLTNVMTERKQYERLYWCVMVGVLLNSFVSIWFLEGLSPAQRADLEALGEHGASLGMNAMLVLFLGALLFRGSSPAKRRLLPIMLVPVGFTYLTAQRRAAVIGLIAALVLYAVVLFWRRRRRFWLIVPLASLLLVGYVGAFWNASGTGVSFPALAVKSVIKPNEIDQKDQQSSMYRILETHDAVYTVRSSPLIGIGFGRKFLRPYPLPAINTFILAEYVTHNSILWIWMKSGIFGFMAMLYLFALALRVGARALRTETDPDYAALTLTSVSFVVMYAMFTYVDISWDAKNMLLLALALAQINSITRDEKREYPIEFGPPPEPEPTAEVPERAVPATAVMSR